MQYSIADFLAKSFDKHFSDDKSSMIYAVFCDLQMNVGITFASWTSDKMEERIRIGHRIKQLREEKNMPAKDVAALAGLHAANFSRIEAGKFSVGLDIISKIANVLGARVEIVKQ